MGVNRISQFGHNSLFSFFKKPEPLKSRFLLSLLFLACISSALAHQSCNAQKGSYSLVQNNDGLVQQVLKFSPKLFNKAIADFPSSDSPELQVNVAKDVAFQSLVFQLGAVFETFVRRYHSPTRIGNLPDVRNYFRRDFLEIIFEFTISRNAP